MSKHTTTQSVRRMAYNNGNAWLTVEGMPLVIAHATLGGATPAMVAKGIVATYGKDEAHEMLVSLYEEAKLNAYVRDYVESLLRTI